MASLPAGINEGQREVLFIIAELSGRSVTNSVHDTAVVVVVEVSGLPAEESMTILTN
jgi:H+/gluconate symporter-like permease